MDFNLHNVILTWFTVILGILFMCIIYINRKLQYWKNQGIPTSVDGIGSILKGLRDFKEKPVHLIHMEIYKKHGRISGSFYGLKPNIFIAEPLILRNILVKDFNVFRNRLKIKLEDPILDNILSSLEDDEWKRIRCIMTPTFTSRRMRKMAYLVKECAESFSKRLSKAADENENSTINCKKYLNSFTIDVVASTAFGTKLDSLDNPNNEFMKKARSASNKDLSYLDLLLMIYPKLMKFLKRSAFYDMSNYFKQFALHAIDRRDKDKMPKANDFLQLLLDAHKGTLETTSEDCEEAQLDFTILPKHKTMSLDEMLSQCVLFLFAGSETSTNTLAYAMYYLGLNPEVQETLIQEVDETWESNKEMNFDVLNKMQYLDAFLSETLRKEPVGIQLIRTCNEDYEITDFDIKIQKGTFVTVPVYAMHHDEEFFPNPEKFDPERFMPENRSSIPPYAYLPFGEGPRNCIGMRFGLMVLKMCIVHVLRDFRILATEETKKPLELFKGQGLLSPKEIIVKIEKRK